MSTSPLLSVRRAHSCLGLTEADAGPLRYQLLHRTAAAILEARRYRARRAVMLVQSFSPDADGFGDYQAFRTGLGIRADQGAISTEMERGGVTLRLGWVSDGLRSRGS